MDSDSTTAGIQDKTYTTADGFANAVDLAAWDMATFCGSCHVGGGFMEVDRNGVRLTRRAKDDTTINTWTSYVQDAYKPTGELVATVERAPWLLPQENYAPAGWGALGDDVNGDGVADAHLMLPNIKEMDCLMCHFEGFNNMMSSVMTYSGMLFAPSMAGSGIMDTNQLSPTYQGYSKNLVELVPPPEEMMTSFASLAPFFGGPDAMANAKLAYLNDAAMARISTNPATQNCKACHMPGALTDMPSMMADFLSSAPMALDMNAQAAGKTVTGLVMPPFDFNAPFGATWDFSQSGYAVSPVINVAQILAGDTMAYIAQIGFPSAMGVTAFNGTYLVNEGDIGGGNPAGTGPLYFDAPITGGQDQSKLKMAVVPFPRAEWFKRGDKWGDASDDVHFRLGCAGCHYDTNTLKVDGATGLSADGSTIVDGKSMCDPGRGFDRMSGIEAGQESDLGDGVVDSRNTVKRCENCHVTGRNDDGVAINTFGAPNPAAAHAAAGLSAEINRVIRLATQDDVTAGLATTVGEEINAKGNHLEIMDCTVCHVYKKQAVVRSLDATSGNRYPNMIGFDTSKGMMGLFEEPTPTMQNEMEEWRAVFTWSMQGDAPRTINGQVNPDWRRKIYAINPIVAALWNNVGTTVDLNGDGATGMDHTAFQATGGVGHFYDPPVMRELKAGMNFGPSGFGPVPVGFGADPNYATAYASDGTFTGAWDYVGVYGGDVKFTRPDQIAAYKALRGAEWENVQYTLMAVPFMVTHNVRGTNAYALGSGGCADCHAPGSNFFSGGIDMVGTAIPAPQGAKFMEQAAVPFNITAKAGDLITGMEMVSVDGHESELVFHTTVDCPGSPVGTGDCVQTKPLDRGELLYEHGTWKEGDAWAWKDVNGNTYASVSEWVSYLENVTVMNDGVLGIGIDPVAAVASVAVNSAPQILESGVYSYQALTQEPVTITADASVNTVGTFIYSWSTTSTDAALVPAADGKSVAATFPTQGSYQVVLKVQDEEGKVDMEVTTVTVKPAPVSAEATVVAGTAPGEITVEFAGLPYDTLTSTYGYDELVVYWGDGDVDKYYAHDREWTRVALLGAGTERLTHEYAEAGSYNVTLVIYTYNTTTDRYEPVEVNPSRESIITVDPTPAPTP